jgi:hypothetical protein
MLPRNDVGRKLSRRQAGGKDNATPALESVLSLSRRINGKSSRRGNEIKERMFELLARALAGLVQFSLGALRPTRIGMCRDDLFVNDAGVFRSAHTKIGSGEMQLRLRK